MAPLGLPMNDHRVDAPPDVVDGCMARYLHPAGLGIDLTLAYGTTVGEDGIVHRVVARHAKCVPRFIADADRASGPARAANARLVLGARNRPSRIRPLRGVAARRTAAISFAFASSSSAAFASTIAACRIDLPEREPSPA
jgi:hypothetical protein